MPSILHMIHLFLVETSFTATVSRSKLMSVKLSIERRLLFSHYIKFYNVYSRQCLYGNLLLHRIELFYLTALTAIANLFNVSSAQPCMAAVIYSTMATFFQPGEEFNFHGGIFNLVGWEWQAAVINYKSDFCGML